jgi:hypothetical protein
MNYLTNFYKNKCEQLQEQFNVLQYKLQYLNEKIDRSVPPPPELLRDPANDYFTNDELRQLEKPKPSGSGSWWIDYLLGALPMIFAMTQHGLVMRGAGLTTIQVSETLLISVLEGLAPVPLAWIPYFAAAGIAVGVGVGGYYYVRDIGDLTVHVLQNLPGAQRIDPVDPEFIRLLTTPHDDGSVPEGQQTQQTTSPPSNQNP